MRLRLLVALLLLPALLGGCGESPAAALRNGSAESALRPPLDEFTSLLGYIESDIGFRKSTGSKYHMGLDIAVPKGRAVRAAGDGQVVYAGCDTANRSIVIWHETLGLSTIYMHLRSLTAAVGDRVSAGQQIGLSGPESGYGPHLDFRVFRGQWPGDCPALNVGDARQYVNPLRYLPRALDTGAPAVTLQTGGTSGFAAPAGEYVPVGPEGIWIRIHAVTGDKDIDSVRVLMRSPEGLETEVHWFDYFAGTAGANATMPMEGDPGSDGYYVAAGSPLEHGKPTDDYFAWWLDPELLGQDGRTHTVVFVVTDAFDNRAEAAVAVRRR